MSYTLGIGGVWFGTFTGDGGGTTYNIPHGLSPQPDYAIVMPGSANAALEQYHISINSTNIVVTYLNATPAGTGNIVLMWMAGREHSIRDEIFSVTSDSIGDDDVPE
jgi:hypothetical protein